MKLEQLPSTAGANFRLVTKWKTSNLSYNLTITSAANKITWLTTGDGSSTFVQVTANTALTSADVGKWIHIAVTHDVSLGASGVVIYKNGIAQADTDDTNGNTSIYDGNAQFEIGRYDGGTEYFDGLINNVRVFSDIRTAQEITDNMYLTLTGTSNNLVGSWYATANNHNDLAGTNNLTAVNTPVFSTNVPWTGANSTDWTISSEIQADPTKVSGASDLTNFPVLIKDGNIPASVYSAMQATGADLRITTDSAGTTEIPFEIVSITPGSSLAEVWAKVPTLLTASATSLYLWAGNSGAIAYDANAPFGSQAVWGSNYKIVQHLEGNSNDSTSNANTHTDTTITYSSANGKFSQGASFNGTTSKVVMGAAVIPTGSLSVSAWAKSTMTAEGAICCNYNLASQNGWLLSVGKNAGDVVSFNYSSAGKETLGTSDATNDTYNYIVGTYDSSAQKSYVYFNGSLEGTYATTFTTSTGGDANLQLGLDPVNGYVPFAGTMDEFRVTAVKNSTDWIATEYANQNDPGTFWSAVVVSSGGRSYMTPNTSFWG